jgi:hypothetical protein
MHTRTRSAFLSPLVLACLLAVAGCSDESSTSSDGQPCEASAECPEGHRCSGQGRCQEPSACYEVAKDMSEGPAAQLDLLWVIDNSESMCDAQKALRESTDAFVGELASRNIDFHVAVTSTREDALHLGLQARNGHLQATPQPVPSAAPGCHGEPGTSGIPDGFAPIRENLEVAIGCTKNPSEWEHLLEVTDEEIQCHLDGECDGEEAHPWQLFPTSTDGGRVYAGMERDDSPYRDIPLVLRADDYRDSAGGIHVEKLERDFACMSLVGTTGEGLEKGLSAAASAVSPRMTGGPIEEPVDPSAPNHGLIRKNSNFGAIFVTDGNDCSHDGSLTRDTVCGDDICAFANHPDLEDDAGLLAIEELADDFLANLVQSKGRSNDYNGDGIVLASFHGRWKRYGEDPSYPEGDPIHPDDCEAMQSPPADDQARTASCRTRWGTTFSGDRYDRFLRQFPQANVFPAGHPGEPLDGLMCAPENIPAELLQLGDTNAGTVSCITDPPRRCESDDDCADFAFGAGQPQCTQFGASDVSYCDSAVQLRLYPGVGVDRRFSDLRDHPYCIPESVDSDATPGGCVISRDRYDLVTCGGLDNAMDLVWSSDTPYEDLIGYEVELVYAVCE